MKQKRKGRWTAFLLAFALVWTSLSIPSMEGREVFAANTSEDFVVNSSGKLTKYKGTELNVVIPESVNGITVQAISENAFNDHKDIKSVVIPGTVEEIETYTFSNCTELESVTFQEGVKSIYSHSFTNCSSLKSITIPASVTYIADEDKGEGPPFVGCSGLESIVVAEGNETYDSRDNCNAIIEKEDSKLVQGCKTTVIPEGVTQIGVHAFNGQSGLKSISFPSDVEKIGKQAFWECSSLESVTIPSNITSIGTEAFSYCSGLKRIVVEEGHPKYDSRDCNAVIVKSTHILTVGCSTTSIPDDVKKIGNDAFRGRTGPENLVLPSSVTEIGNYAFDDCGGIKSMIIPKGVNKIGENAFSGCRDLETISVEDGNTTYDSRDNCNAVINTSDETLVTGGKKVNVPEGVDSIGKYAFAGRTGLEIVLSSSVRKIDEGAFRECDNSTITIPKSVSYNNIGAFAFYDLGENVKLRVYPYSDAESYARNNKIPYEVIGADPTPDPTPDPDPSPSKYVVELPEGETSISNTQMADVLEQNKTKDVVIKTAGVTFTFEKGKMQAVDGKTAYDFGVELITDYSALANPDFKEAEFAFQIHYSYEGQLPGEAVISIPVGSKWAGKRLYYYETDENGDDTYVCRTTVAADGTYTVKQNHCSSYVAMTKVPEKLGDCDGEDGITSKDALAVLKYSLNIPQENFHSELADCDGEDGITSKDALAILKCSLQLPVQLY